MGGQICLLLKVNRRGQPNLPSNFTLFQRRLLWSFFSLKNKIEGRLTLLQLAIKVLKYSWNLEPCDGSNNSQSNDFFDKADLFSNKMGSILPKYHWLKNSDSCISIIPQIPIQIRKSAKVFLSCSTYFLLFLQLVQM